MISSFFHITGRELWVIALGYPGTPSRHRLLVPEVKLVANIHGNEVRIMTTDLLRPSVHSIASYLIKCQFHFSSTCISIFSAQ
jgi:hypothetical protein